MLRNVLLGDAVVCLQPAHTCLDRPRRKSTSFTTRGTSWMFCGKKKCTNTLGQQTSCSVQWLDRMQPVTHLVASCHPWTDPARRRRIANVGGLEMAHRGTAAYRIAWKLS